LDGDRRVKVDDFRRCAQRHDEAIAERQVGSVGALVVLPPAADRVNRDEVAVGEFGTGPLPDVLMQ
jgi:hypothetical protein